MKALLTFLGVRYDVLDLATDPRWRAQVVLLNQAADSRLRADRLEAQAFAQLEAVALGAVKPRRRAVPKAAENVVELTQLRRRA